MRALLCDMLSHRGFEAVAAADAAEAARLFAEVDPDVLLTDIDLGTRPTGVELAVMLTALAPHLAVVFLSSFPRAATGDGTMGVASAVFVSKSEVTSAEVVVTAIEAALHATTPPRPTDATPPPSALAGLTRRQIDVLALVARGWSNEQIAAERGVGTRAVERAISRIFDRLGLTGSRGTNARVRASALYLAEFGPIR